MNVYLNYYKDNEFTKGDNDPIGIILCSGKNEALVKYATMGLPQQVFVSKYLINLPSEKELQKIIEEEKGKAQMLSFQNSAIILTTITIGNQRNLLTD